MSLILGEAWAKTQKIRRKRDELWKEEDERATKLYLDEVYDVFGENCEINLSTGEVTCNERSVIPFSEFRLEV